MTNIEFTDLVCEMNPEYKTFTQEEFEIIQTVYNYYPSINEKRQIAELYVKHGMILIKDMHARSKTIAELEDEIRGKRFELDKLKEKMKELEV
jgi:predicted Ser/Thr protein kinase